MLLGLELGDAHDARGRERGPEDELLLLQVAVLERDLADLELHAARREVAHERRELLVVRRLRAFHEEVHALRVRHGDDLGLGIDVEVVADVAQAFRRLREPAIEVVDDFFLRVGSGPSASMIFSI